MLDNFPGRTLLSCAASVSRSNMRKEFVLAHGRWATEWTDERKTFGLERIWFKLPSKILTSWPTCHSLCIEPLATSVWLLADFIAAVYSGRDAIWRHCALP